MIVLSQGTLLCSGEAARYLWSLSPILQHNLIIERATVTRVTAFPVREGESWMSMLQHAEDLSLFSLPKNEKTNIPWRRQMSTSPR